jgi:SPX domain protein involved in polyphosphate accumulation
MKFGKQLKVQSRKEWQEHYMSYKRLKRIIKKLCVQIKEKQEHDEHANEHDILKPKLSPSKSKPNLSRDNSKRKLSTESEDENVLMTGDARKEFFAVVENDIDKVKTKKIINI